MNRAFDMKQNLLATICLSMLLLLPIQAQDATQALTSTPVVEPLLPASVPVVTPTPSTTEPAPTPSTSIATVAPMVPVRLTTAAESTYLHDLTVRGRRLETQGLLIESLDGSKVFAELNGDT